ncbi:MAG: hypothetical protein Q4D63_06095 [Neisseria animaloris]|nr:hypothetical protein [Neisseria animaloris]
MLYRFVCDAADTLRLRYRAAEEYRYSRAVFIGVLLLLGLVNAAGLSPLFGNTSGVIAMAVCFAAAKWAVLSAVMQRRLNIPAAGFVLATEALYVPTLLVFYLPQLAFAAALWQLWTFAVQLIGLMRLSGKSGGQVVIAYIIYLLCLLAAGMAITLLFSLSGLIDVQTLHEQMRQTLEAPR